MFSIDNNYVLRCFGSQLQLGLGGLVDVLVWAIVWTYVGTPCGAALCGPGCVGDGAVEKCLTVHRGGYTLSPMIEIVVLGLMALMIMAIVYFVLDTLGLW